MEGKKEEMKGRKEETNGTKEETIKRRKGEMGMQRRRQRGGHPPSFPGTVLWVECDWARDETICSLANI